MPAPPAPFATPWSAEATARPWTVGVEEEVLLIDARGSSAAQRAEDVFAGLPPDLARRTAIETHACVIELTSAPHATAAEAAAELDRLRQDLASSLAPLELRGAVAGTHPLVEWRDVRVTRAARYSRVRAQTRELAAREPTCALHVHVAVPGAELAVRALDGLRGDLPLLLALAANSPYWQGRDTGLASARIPILAMFPRQGMTRPFGSYAAYLSAIDALVRSGAVPDPSFIWWDVRLRPHLGTVEVRIMDAQTRVADTGALAALVQCLVQLRALGAPPPVTAPEVVAENRFLAARDGVAGGLIQTDPPRLVPTADRLGELLDACAPLAGPLGCARELAAVAGLVERPGHLRQREIGAAGGLDAVVADLAAHFAPEPPALEPQPSVAHSGVA